MLCKLSNVYRGDCASSLPSNIPVRRRPALLVVDDEESICFSLKEYFSHNGFIVDTAGEVEDAEKLISRSKYKVVIQDLRMGAKKDSEGLNNC